MGLSWGLSPNLPNRLKRVRAIGQLVEQEQPKRGKYRAPVIIAGDFNADRFSPEFKDEHIFRTLAAANFVDAFKDDDKSSRITYQSTNRKYGSTLVLPPELDLGSVYKPGATF